MASDPDPGPSSAIVFHVEQLRALLRVCPGCGNWRTDEDIAHNRWCMYCRMGLALD